MKTNEQKEPLQPARKALAAPVKDRMLRTGPTVNRGIATTEAVLGRKPGANVVTGHFGLVKL